MPEGISDSKEAQNAYRVKKLLLDIPGLVVRTLREDLFLISEPESGVEFTTDVEGDTLFLTAEVSRVPGDADVSLLRYLLEENARTVHVAFALDGDRLLLSGNLELSNLDPNELEASCRAMILTLYRTSERLSELLKR